MLEHSGAELRVLTSLILRLISKNFKSVDLDDNEWRHSVEEVTFISLKVCRDRLKF